MTTVATVTATMDPSSIICDSCAKILPLKKPYLSRLWNPDDAVLCRNNYEVCKASLLLNKKVNDVQVEIPRLVAVKDPLDGKWYRPEHFLTNPQRANLQQDCILRAETERDMYAIAVMNSRGQYEEGIMDWRPTVQLNRYTTKYKIYWKKGGKAIGYYHYTIEPIKHRGALNKLVSFQIMDDAMPKQKNMPVRGQIYIIPEERRKGHALEMVRVQELNACRQVSHPR